MTIGTLILRSLRFHWRAHLGALLGATLAAAVLVGALAVGDSVRYSLREMALERLGGIHLALIGGERFFRTEMADRAAANLNAPAAPIILLPGTVTAQPSDGDPLRADRVQIVGVDERFWNLGVRSQGPGGRRTRPPARQSPTSDALSGLVLNERLARKLNIKVGEEALLRVDKPSLLSRDAPLSTVEDAAVTLRLPVSAIVSGAEFGNFSLQANQIPPYNAFVPLPILQKAVGMAGRANVLLMGEKRLHPLSKEVEVLQISDTLTPESATAALWKHWQFADASLELRELPDRDRLELRTDRVFLDPPVAQAALKGAPQVEGVLTYFVNELRVGNRATPYSTVAAMQGEPVPPNMADDEILINRWLADDLQAKPGDTLTLRYWTVGPMRRLEEKSSAFRIRAILPLAGAAADPTLMPNIPGLADKKDCRDWEPGVPIDLAKIRDKDQAYWSAYRGTPKAFLTLRAGQRLWNNRFGNLTAARYPLAGGASRPAVEACIRQALNPSSLGLFFVPVREQALAASSPTQDFGQLFLGLSFFLIVAALILTVLLFAFALEQRAEEVGTLLALGFPPKRVQSLLLWEGGALALLASVAGAGLALLYTRAVIGGLSTVWSGAVGNSTLQFHVEPRTLASGAGISFLVALLSIWLVTRRQACAPARELLSAGAESQSRLLSGGGKTVQGKSRKTGLIAALVALVLAGVLAAAAMVGSPENAVGFFFGAGALLLIGGIALCRWLMTRLESEATPSGLTLNSLGARNSARRLGRSLSAIGLLACGSFLVIAVGANRKDANAGAERRSSGTGGFALYGEATLPVYHDLNTPEGREAFGLDAEELAGAQFVALRLREGDEASCLNLNRAQTPRLLGVDPDELRRRGAFSFAATIPGADPKDPWKLLEREEPDGAIPVIGDANTVAWSLGAKLGATLPYTDDRGNTRRLRIVGMLTNSILQGGLLLSEAQFTRLFPGNSGYRVFLIDAPPKGAAEVSRTLNRALEDVGLSLTPAPERLAEFNAVENTYLSIFALLGGLGLLLGSVGLGVIVLRNVLERRGELALLRAIGFRRGALHWLLFSEHALLLALGLLVGVVAALVAVLPALRAPGGAVPVVSLAVTLLAIFVSGFVWTWAATLLALRGPLLSALRSE